MTKIFRSRVRPEVRITMTIHVSFDRQRAKVIDDILVVDVYGSPDQLVIDALLANQKRQFVGKHPDEWITVEFDLT